MQPTSQFQNAVAVVTGGTQGLGETIARTLAERGAAGLVICGRNAERGEAVAREITAQGCQTEFVRADLGILVAVRNALEVTLGFEIGQVPFPDVECAFVPVFLGHANLLSFPKPTPPDRCSSAMTKARDMSAWLDLMRP